MLDLQVTIFTRRGGQSLLTRASFTVNKQRRWPENKSGVCIFSNKLAQFHWLVSAVSKVGSVQ